MLESVSSSFLASAFILMLTRAGWHAGYGLWKDPGEPEARQHREDLASHRCVGCSIEVSVDLVHASCEVSRRSFAQGLQPNIARLGQDRDGHAVGDEARSPGHVVDVDEDNLRQIHAPASSTGLRDPAQSGAYV